MEILPLERMASIIEKLNMKKVSEESDVSIYHVRKVKNKDGSVPYREMEKLSGYLREMLGVK